MTGNFLIGEVDEVLNREQVITATVGTEFKVRAYPLRSIQEVQPHDEVLLIRVSQEFDTYMYVLLRLNQDFTMTYGGMQIGFDITSDTVVVKGPRIRFEGDKIEFAGNVKFVKGSVTLQGKNGTESVGAFNVIKNCPLADKLQPHSVSTIQVDAQQE